MTYSVTNVEQCHNVTLLMGVVSSAAILNVSQETGGFTTALHSRLRRTILAKKGRTRRCQTSYCKKLNLRHFSKNTLEWLLSKMSRSGEVQQRQSSTFRSPCRGATGDCAYCTLSFHSCSSESFRPSIETTKLLQHESCWMKSYPHVQRLTCEWISVQFSRIGRVRWLLCSLRDEDLILYM